MSTERPGYSEICAYVDDELDADAAARVAYAAARDPETAAQIAQLTKLKSVLPGVHAAPQVTPTAHKPTHKWTMAVAAAIGLVLFGGALLAELQLREPAQAAFFEIGIAAHRTWSATSETGVRTIAANRSVFAAPDLSAAQLQLQTAEALDHGTRNILHFGYVGNRGCRLSLFVNLHADAAPPEIGPQSGVRTAAWHHKGIAFLTVADGMDEARFHTIVTALRQYSIDPAPFPPPTETLLAESRQQSRPCAA